MKNESVKFGKNLKRIRTEKGITQDEIARFLEVNRGYISNIENGKSNPTLSTIAKLAKAIKTEMNDLIK